MELEIQSSFGEPSFSHHGSVSGSWSAKIHIWPPTIAELTVNLERSHLIRESQQLNDGELLDNRHKNVEDCLAVYGHVLSEIESKLRAHFKHVGHALEAPAKTSHGDIDVLVAEPTNKSGPVTGAFLAQVLGADKWKRTGGSSTFNLALRWPKEMEEMGGITVAEEGASPSTGADTGEEAKETQKLLNLATTTDPSPSPAPSISSQKYIQVDIHHCPKQTYFTWHLFFQAHGDLRNILGGIIRRHGLTCTSKGLCLRIAEVESHNKEQSRVLMTNSPTTVLSYLGLDTARYWEKFASWDEMMKYAASCRFHDPGHWRERHAEKKATELKANDRQRGAKRPVFAYWIDEYWPAHQDDEPGKSAHLARDEVVEDAKMYFDPDFAERFDDRKTRCVRQINVGQLWADIRKGLPLEGVEIGWVMKGMKRGVASRYEDMPDSEDVPGLREVKAAYAEGRFEDVLVWARENWRGVLEKQKKLDQEKSHAHLTKIKRKKEKENAQTGCDEGRRHEIDPRRTDWRRS
ncbi:uncharacterized protein Z518_04713 [Rhinocladiella mackenziei CBS 650.93]|uniref:Uncharacterized protein n=1 Tax=Rhinocladiella mackenziei CBS 650.93 TaxID=1442369 RepID=A0A0D2FWT0_9EURO|nr:uncharacterized protein Z518_04713 [Rhinocladiella mackenziei CBS 650.93]KIX06737.1 hypothetical protein Z518_04713 [Rhinocladiella mackenziei CBS 650.93]